MDSLDLEVVRRCETGKCIARRMRAEGFVPAVVYSHGRQALHVMVSDYAFRMAVRGKSSTQIFKFRSNDLELEGVTVLVRDVQLEPIKESIRHIDFLRVTEEKKVSVTVSIKITGEIDAVKQGLAFIQQILYKVDVYCFPNAIPAEIVANISGIRPGHALTTKDLPLPDGVKLSSSANATVLSVFAKNKAVAGELEQSGAKQQVKAAKK